MLSHVTLALIFGLNKYIFLLQFVFSYAALSLKNGLCFKTTQNFKKLPEYISLLVEVSSLSFQINFCLNFSFFCHHFSLWNSSQFEFLSLVIIWTLGVCHNLNFWGDTIFFFSFLPKEIFQFFYSSHFFPHNFF